MKGWIANTNHDWFDFLAQKRFWPEVNFWTPSDYFAFRGGPGSPFFFRLLAPRNVIGGFGYVQRFARLPEWLAWECFGEGNGASSLQVMSERLLGARPVVMPPVLPGRRGARGTRVVRMGRAQPGLSSASV